MSELVRDVRCRICGAVIAPGTGAGIRTRRGTLAVCEQHAPLIRTAVAGARELAISTTRTVLRKRFPNVFAVGVEAMRLWDAVRPRTTEEKV